MANVTPDIVAGIALGSYDEDLDRLEAAIRGRRTMLVTEAALTLKVGDPIVIGGNISPRYLNGARATVHATAAPGAKRIEATLDEPVGRFHAGVPFGIPLACVTKLDVPSRT